MSHFTVLVIGNDVEAQLAPFHEYESTGKKDEYVVEVDVTDKVIEYFNRPQDVVRLADGTHYDRYDDRFYTGEPEHRHGRKIFVLPSGAEIITGLSADEARTVGVGPKTLDEAARSYYGDEVIIRDGVYYNLTNPNARWDWWVVGGRWSGVFKLKPGRRGTVGKPAWNMAPCPSGYADSALKGAIDFEQMRNDEEVKARAFWNDTRRITGGTSWDSWDDTLTRYCGAEDDQGKRPNAVSANIDLARREYGDQPAIELLKASKLQAYSWEIDDSLALDCEVYVQRRRDQTCVPFAFIRDKVWTEKGTMGWLGMSHDTVSETQWNVRFHKMLDELDDSVLLTMVDCHI